ncbi:hypothetical protein [Salipiger sp.]|uniref:hypothetical protein n=1 Tax=Salipiger sp. TaxID=2078585 RepID=UPI003A9694AC
MRKYAFRKMTQDDFAARVRRLDSGYGRTVIGRTEAPVNERPFLSILGGFVLAYVVISVARNREFLEDSLHQGNLPAQYHQVIFGVLAALLAISAVMVLYHLFRWTTKRGAKKRNSGSLLAGAMAAGVLIYTPASVFEAGFNMLDPNSRQIILAATSSVQETLPGVDFGSVAFVSSQGN